MDRNPLLYEEIIFEINNVSYRANVLFDDEKFQEQYRINLKVRIFDGNLPKNYKDISINLFEYNDPFDTEDENALGFIIPKDENLDIRIICRSTALEKFTPFLTSKDEREPAGVINIKIPKIEEWKNLEPLPILEYGFTLNYNLI